MKKQKYNILINIDGHNIGLKEIEGELWEKDDIKLIIDKRVYDNNSYDYHATEFYTGLSVIRMHKRKDLLEWLETAFTEEVKKTLAELRELNLKKYGYANQ